jgi:hypothetical protein
VTHTSNDTIHVKLNYTEPEMVSIGGIFDKLEIRLNPMELMYFDSEWL